MFNSLRFYISWIASAVFMYVAFYIWHGMFLNDLERISFSKALFMILAALVYLIISFIVYKIFDSKLLLRLFYPPLMRGVASGIIVGFSLFAITTVLGITFTKNLSFTYMIADCGWQISEQVIGGVIIGFAKILIYDPQADIAH